MLRMVSVPSLLAVCVFNVIAPAVQAVDYRVEKLDEAPPTDAVSAEVAAELSATGIRVIRGASTKFCDVWFRKAVTVTPNFKPTTEVLYPFRPGDLIGVARFARKAADFRDQEIAPGVYTLRYSQQPVDGAHVGTSPTRDFLLLLSAEHDQTAKILEYKPLTKQSAEAAGSAHPALFPLQKVATSATEFPAIRHDEERDWWIVALHVPTQAGTAAVQPLTVELVIVGVAAE